MSATNTNLKPPLSPTTANLPPPRRGKGLKPVTPVSVNEAPPLHIHLALSHQLPLHSTPTAQFNIRRWVVESHLGQASTVSGGEKASVQEGRKCGGEDQRALAKVLGMTSKELAVAIASAVWQHVLAPASLSCLATKEGGPVVEALPVEGRAGDRSEEGTGATESVGVAGGVFSGIENFVGMDET